MFHFFRNLQLQCSHNAKIGCFQFRAKNGINYNMFCTPKHTHKEAVVDTKNEKKHWFAYCFRRVLDIETSQYILKSSGC